MISFTRASALSLTSAVFMAVSLGCGSSRPIQEEPNAPTGAAPTVPGPQNGSEPVTAPPNRAPDEQPNHPPDPPVLHDPQKTPPISQ